MTDNDILDYFCGKKHKNIQHKKLINIPNIYLDYLNNRYNDSLSIRETIIRIKLNIDKHPLCPICNSPVLMHKYKSLFLSTCGNINCLKIHSKQKFENTMLKKYGYKYNFQNNDILKKANNKTTSIESINKRKEIHNSKTIDEKNKIIEKRKLTCIKKYNQYSSFIIDKVKKTKLERYGDENYINFEKIKQTNLKRYGYEFPFQSKSIIKQIHEKQIQKYGCLAFNTDIQKQTCLKRYGVDNVFKSEKIKKKIKQTRYNNYGQYQSIKQIIKSKSKEVKEKRINTMHKNGTLNSSKIENESYQLLKQKYPDTIHHFKDKERYPFVCDFYIPSLDLFIECQYGQFHNGRPYLGINEDLNELELLRQKSEKRKQETGKPKTRYDAVIDTWVNRDPMKRKIAKENNLNYIEFWNINELINWL